MMVMSDQQKAFGDAVPVYNDIQQEEAAGVADYQTNQTNEKPLVIQSKVPSTTLSELFGSDNSAVQNLQQEE